MFCKTSAPGPSASCDHSKSDIAVASSNRDIFNVIYRLYTLILLVCFKQIYVHSSPNTLLITRNALKIITMVLVSRNHRLSWEEQDCCHLWKLMQICKMQCHWLSQMEWLGLNQSVLLTHKPHVALYFLFYHLGQIRALLNQGSSRFYHDFERF